MTLSPDQIARRLEGITATDVAAIIGVHPNRSAIDVWRSKRGEVQPWDGNERTRWGEILEVPIRTDYERRHGLRIEVPGTLEHPEAPWQLCTPDGIAYQGIDPERGLEIKCHTFRLMHLYGSPGTDEVPPHVLVQAVWSMGVTGLSRWDVVSFIDGQPTDYIVDRDDELIGMLRERAERFLVDCVRGGAVPDPDGSESFDAWLKARHKTNTDVLIEVNDAEVIKLIDRAKLVRAQGADLDDEHAKIVQALKLKIGDSAGLIWTNAKGKPEKVTWKRNKEGKRVDLALLCKDNRDTAALTVSARGPEIERALICLGSLDEHTVIGHSSRATITAGEIKGCMTIMQDTLSMVARRTEAAYSAVTPGNRPFVWPRQWKGPKERKESDS